LSSLIGLDGANEACADTIRKFLQSHVSEPDVMFLSEGGINQGGMVVTPTVAASATLTSTDGSNHITLTWRDLGTARNAWHVRIRAGSMGAVDIRNGQEQVRITIPNGSTMQELDDLLAASDDLNAVIIVSAMQGAGNPTETIVDNGDTMFTGGAEDVVNREKELTSNDMKYFEREANVFVKVYDGDRESLESANGFDFMRQSVYIDIFGKHAHDQDRRQMYVVRDAIDNAIITHMTGPYTKSHEPSDSGILGFENYSIDWQRIPEDLERGITSQLSGVLNVHIQRSVE